MPIVIAGLLLLLLGTTVLRGFLRANPAAMARWLKQGAGVAALLVAFLMLFRGQVDVALGLAGIGFVLTSGRKAPFLSAFARRGGGRRGARVSRVRSAMIEMELDRDTGVMRGGVLRGPLVGRALDGCTLSELLGLLDACRSADPEGARLLEAYLDRRSAGWRETAEREDDPGRAEGPYGRRSRGGMSEEEAYELLGLEQGASREAVARAHRTLMKRYHPDHGGSTDMAARVNEAKDVLMRRHL